MKKSANILANMSLRTKISAAFLIITFLSFGLLARVYTQSTRTALTNEANQVLFAAAARTAASLDSFIESGLNSIRTEAHAGRRAEEGDIVW